MLVNLVTACPFLRVAFFFKSLLKLQFMETILKQEYTITNPFNEKMALKALSAQLSSIIFKELINKEKAEIRLTFILEVSEN